MFRKQTTFIIGAGAGKDIDMCLGSTLIDEISNDVYFNFRAGEFYWDLPSFERRRKLKPAKMISSLCMSRPLTARLQMYEELCKTA